MQLMNDRSECSSGHLKAKLGEVLEATLQVAPNRSEAYIVLMSFVLMSLRANVTKLLLALACIKASIRSWVRPGNTKGGSITVPLTSCLTGLESVV